MNRAPRGGAGDRSLASRFLALAAGDDPETSLSKLRAFRMILFLEVIGENVSYLGQTLTLSLPPNPLTHLTLAAQTVTVGALTVCFLLVLRRRREREATVVAAVVLAAVVLEWFPETGNHQYLACLLMSLLACIDPGDEQERVALLCSLRWIAVFALFHTGFQKALYGLYVHGDFLAHAIAREGRFAALFGLLLPAKEIARLAALGPAAPGRGPYRPDSVAFVAASNATMVMEMGLPFLLLVRRTRVIAAATAALFLIGVEAGAREVFFGVLFVNLLALFHPRDVNRKLVPLFAALVTADVLIRVFAPHWRFR